MGQKSGLAPVDHKEGAWRSPLGGWAYLPAAARRLEMPQPGAGAIPALPNS